MALRTALRTATKGYSDRDVTETAQIIIKFLYNLSLGHFSNVVYRNVGFIDENSRAELFIGWAKSPAYESFCVFQAPQLKDILKFCEKQGILKNIDDSLHVQLIHAALAELIRKGKVTAHSSDASDSRYAPDDSALIKFCEHEAHMRKIRRALKHTSEVK